MKNRSVSQWIQDSLARSPARSNSMLISVYGDAIAPHGGTVWLGSFIRLAEALGINERLVRTSVFRLSKENWLTAEHIGRRSYYSLTTTGRRRFEHAYRRIYNAPENQWNGDWQIIIARDGTLAPAVRDAMRKDLMWEGFGIIAPGVFAHPSADSNTVLDILQQTDTQDKVVLLRGQHVGNITSAPLHVLAQDCWNLDELAQDYKRFIERFQPMLSVLRAARDLDPEQCFVVRTLLIHEFRRVLLRDPQLPNQLLPADWPGNTARQLCRDLYCVTQLRAEEHLMSVLETSTGRLPPADAYYYERFGGLRSGTKTKGSRK